MSKLKIAFHWLASCGGCEISLLDTDELILDLAAIADIVFMPLAVDGKWNDIYAMDDNEIDISLINGAVRNEEDIHAIKLLRQKSKTIIAYGQCSTSGGIIGLGNTFNVNDLLEYAYKNAPSVSEDVTPADMPTASYKVDGTTLTLPLLNDQVTAIDQHIDVDYYLPGCPPPVPKIVNAIVAIKNNKLPPKGSFLTSSKSVCDECDRKRSDRRDLKISEFKRPHEVSPGELESDKCLLEQGVICLGPITRSCGGHYCMNVNMPCRGCLGLTPDTRDPAAKMISVVSQFSANMSDDEVKKLTESIVDPVGLFYRFSFPKALITKSLYKEV